MTSLMVLPVFRLDDPFVADLQRQLAVKDDLLTETRLEALSSASQLQVPFFRGSYLQSLKLLLIESAYFKIVLKMIIK